MPTKYVKITKSEFEKELRLIEKDLELAHPFQILPLDDTAEYVYATRVYSPTKRERPLTLRIYSSIVPTTYIDYETTGLSYRPKTVVNKKKGSEARGVGQDAIRVVVVTFKNLVVSSIWDRAMSLKGQAQKDEIARLKQDRIPKWVPERVYPAVKGKRVHRVEGWRKNLRTRITQVIDEIF